MCNMSPTITAEQKPTPQADQQPETSVYSSAGDGTPKQKRYRFINAISESQTSSVWRARDTLTGTDVAVKRLTGSTDDVARQRLTDEAQVSDRVSHPGLVPVLDSWFEPDEAALVFPYVPGQTLAQRLHETGPLSPRDAATIALELADILAATHDAQLIHRDVKPGNVLLAEDGRTRLVDFGISSSGDVDEASLELTGSGMAIGTLPYMAPEQLTGGTPTPAVDVYALGIVLFEMLSGTRPYNGKSPTEQLHLQQSPPPPIAAPTAIAALMFAALDPVPERRPSAAQLGRSLWAWLDGRIDTDAPTALVAAAAAAEGQASTPPLSPSARSTGRNRSRSRLVGAGMVAVAAIGLAALAAFALGGGTNSLDDRQSNVPAVAVRSEPSVSPGPAESSATPTTPEPARPIATVPSDGRSAVSNPAPAPQKPNADTHVKHKHHHGHRKHHHHGHH
jgi:serine/threonine protein kinase